jgi:hypothetical protein
MAELSTYRFSTLRKDDLALYRGAGDAVIPILMVVPGGDQSKGGLGARLDMDTGKTNEADYPSLSIEDASKAAGGIQDMVFGPVNRLTFPAKGRFAKVVGLIVSHEPDPQDEPDQRTWQPRYFTLESEMGWQRVASEKGGNPVMPTTINLDIESLNRHDRQFIIDHCRPLWAAEPVSMLASVISPCRGTVWGHFDEIVGRQAAEIRYVGIVADQVDIAPLTSSAARPGMLSNRSLTGK